MHPKPMPRWGTGARTQTELRRGRTAATGTSSHPTQRHQCHHPGTEQGCGHLLPPEPTRQQRDHPPLPMPTQAPHSPHPTPHPHPPLGSRSSVGSKAAGTALSAVGHRRVGRAFHPHSLLLLWLSAAWSQPPPPSVGAISLGAGGGGTAPCAKPYGRGQGRTEATREGWGKKHIYIILSHLRENREGNAPLTPIPRIHLHPSALQHI